MVRAGRDQVRTIGTECTVPDPPLMSRERRLERQGRLLIAGLEIGTDLPYLGRVVGRACRQLLDVRRQEDAGDVFLVGGEGGDGVEFGPVVGLDQLPEEYVALFPNNKSLAFQTWDIWMGRRGRRTALLAAHNRLPSLATVTLLTLTSPSGSSI